MPPHKGHLLVCDVARRRVDQLTVFVCSHDAEPIDGMLRAAWMKHCLQGPGSNVVHMHRNIPQEPKDHPDFWQIWENAINEHHPEPIDFVFGSEDYIYKLADVLNAKPFIVDRERKFVPVSGTAIREHPKSNWGYIPSLVRPHFQKRVTLIGAESSGKSSLSDRLADRFETKAIPEYGRSYDFDFKQGKNWTEDDFMMIAKGHLAQAEAIASIAGPIVVEDTDLLQTVVWSEALLSNAPTPLVEKLKHAARPDLYLLLNPETEWVDDGTRYHSSTEERQWFNGRLKVWLQKTGANWVEVSGESWEDRQREAQQIISRVLG